MKSHALECGLTSLVLLTMAGLMPAGSAHAVETASAQTLIQVDRIVSSYSQEANLSQKRGEIVDVLVGAAVRELEATCRARNQAILDSTGRQLCSGLSYCPDMVIRVQKESNNMSLNVFLETQETFSDVSFGFTVSWKWDSPGATLSACYAPAIHPSILELRQGLITDPYFINRVAFVAD